MPGAVEDQKSTGVSNSIVNDINSRPGAQNFGTEGNQPESGTLNNFFNEAASGETGQNGGMEEQPQEEKRDDKSLKEHKEDYDKLKEKLQGKKPDDGQKPEGTGEGTPEDTSEGPTQNLAGEDKLPADKLGQTGTKEIGKEGADTLEKQAGKEIGKDAVGATGKEGAKELGKDAAKTAGKEIGKDTAKAAGKELAKDATKAAAKTVAKTGLKAGAELALDATGVGIIVSLGIEAVDKILTQAGKALKKANDWLKEHGIDLKEMFDNMAKNWMRITAGVLILVTMGGCVAIGMPAISALNGGKGKSDVIPSQQNGTGIQNLLLASDQDAVLNPGAENASDSEFSTSKESPETLRNSSGSNIEGYKRLRFTKRDLEFLNNIKTKGFDTATGSMFDERVMSALLYLANRHSSIYVSNIVSVYEKMKIDKENSNDPQVIRNISAHVSGQAADIREIDFVYKGIDMMSACNDTTGMPKKDIVWFNDLSQELYRQRCKGKAYQIFGGGPTINGIQTKPIPIKIAWQDDPPKLSANRTGTKRGEGESDVEQSLGLPRGSLDRTNGIEQNQQVGFAELAQQLGAPVEMIGGLTKEQFFSKLGEAYIEMQTHMPSNVFGGNTLADVATNMAGQFMDEAYGLVNGSWNGNNLYDLTVSGGKAVAEKEFGLSKGVFNDPATGNRAVNDAKIDSEDISRVAAVADIPVEQLAQFFSDLAQGTLNNDILSMIGARLYERSWGMENGALNPNVSLAKKKIADPANQETAAVDLSNLIMWDGVKTTLDSGENVDVEKLKPIMSKLGNGGDIKNENLTLGGSRLDRWGGLGEITTFNCITNQQCDIKEQLESLENVFIQSSLQALYKNDFENYKETLGQNTLDQGLTNGPASMTVGLTEEEKQLFKTEPLTAAGKLGTRVLGYVTDCRDCSIDEIKAKKGELLKDVDQSLGYADGTTAKILSGDSQAKALVNARDMQADGTIQSEDPKLMKHVYRPEARRKVHQVINELLDMPYVLQNMNYKVTQLITFNRQRDVDPFESKLEKLYDAPIDKGGSRANNYGLFSMIQAHPNIHIGY